MTENTRGHAERDTGSGRHGGGRRTRGWIMALALLGFGAAGGALTMAAVDAGAHGGWHDRFRMHGHAHPVDATEATERLQRVAAWTLGRVDATAEQRERIDAILAEAVADLFPLRVEHRTHERDLIAGLARPDIDRTELEQVRTATLALVERATARMLDATVAIAEVLDPEQRQQLLEKLAEHAH